MTALPLHQVVAGRARAERRVRVAVAVRSHEHMQNLMAARRRFGAGAAPRVILWRTDWPELPSGKTDLRALAADLP